MKILRYKLAWGIAVRKELSASGYHEVVAAFTSQQKAKEWARNEYGKFWTDRYILVPISTVFYIPVRTRNVG